MDRVRTPLSVISLMASLTLSTWRRKAIIELLLQRTCIIAVKAGRIFKWKIFTHIDANMVNAASLVLSQEVCDGAFITKRMQKLERKMDDPQQFGHMGVILQHIQ